MTTDTGVTPMGDLDADDVAILTVWTGSDRLRREWEAERHLDRCLADIYGWPVPTHDIGEAGA